MTYRILVMGSRMWTDREVIEQALQFHYLMASMEDSDVVLVHGACPTGADALADEVWREQTGLTPERHPAEWRLYGKYAGPRRNQEMVDLGARQALAFRMPGSRGTADCIQRVQRAKIPLKIWMPGVLAPQVFGS